MFNLSKIFNMIQKTKMKIQTKLDQSLPLSFVALKKKKFLKHNFSIKF